MYNQTQQSGINVTAKQETQKALCYFMHEAHRGNYFKNIAFV